MPFSLLPANTNQAVSFIRLRDQGWADFIQYWISTSFVQKLIALNSVQSAQPNLSMEELGDLLLPFPPNEEMRNITDHIQRSLTQFSKLEGSIKESFELLKERRSALISAAVTGKINVRNWQPPADESAFEEVARDGQEAAV
jgi:type I restriction enzyme S subunit